MGSLLSALTSALAKKELNKYASLFESMQLTTPAALREAENMLTDLAYTGDPYYRASQENIETQTATNLNQLRDLLSGSNWGDTFVDIITRSMGMQRELDKRQSAALQKGQMNLVNFFANVKAPSESNVAQYNNQLKAAAAQERMKAKAIMLQNLSLSNDVGDIASLFGSSDQSDLLSSMFAGTTIPSNATQEDKGMLGNLINTTDSDIAMNNKEQSGLLSVVGDLLPILFALI